jgi:membrane-bound lytic murein transglycosylase D
MSELEKVPSDERVKWSHYTVKKGDTLGKIAKDFRTSVEQLKTTNKLKGNNLRLGQDLLIPKSTTAGSHPAPVVSFLSAREKNELLRGNIGVKGVHEVRSGDTLWSISRKYGVKLSDLLAANNLTSKSVVRAKQKLKIPGTVEKTATVVKRSDSANSNRIRYTVRSGDSLHRIAQKFSVDLDDLRRWNNLNNDVVRSGKKLTIYLRDANGG